MKLIGAAEANRHFSSLLRGDALILSVAADQKCRLLLNADFQHGLVTVFMSVLTCSCDHR
jgi:predicted nucleic acid-binding protein